MSSPNISITLLIVCCLLGLTSCQSGPKISQCVSDGVIGLECSTWDLKPYKIGVELIDNYVCFSPVSARVIFESCTKSPALVDVCVMSAQDKTLYCSTWDGVQHSIAFDQTANYVCYSPNDAQTLFQYCAGPPRKGY